MSDLQLIEAVKTGDLQAIRQLIESGDDLNQQDEQGWPPLNWAAGKGDTQTLKMLLENGADLFLVGRDQRTPYMIALAASNAEAARLLRDEEKKRDTEKLSRPARKYCKAYPLGRLRAFGGWSEVRVNWKQQGDADTDNNSGELSDDDIVFLHQDLTVTQSMWHDENVIFNQVGVEWEDFCRTALQFKALDELDFIPSVE